MGTAVLCPSEKVDRWLVEAVDCVSEIRSTLHLLDAPELARHVPQIAKLIASTEAAKLEGLRLADALHVGDVVGARSTADWIADATGQKTGSARREVDLAAKLDDLAEVGEALAEGTISKTQADVLAGAVGATGGEQRDLLNIAGSASVGELEQAVKQFQLDRNTAPPTVAPGVILTRRSDSVTVEGVLDPVGGELVAIAMSAAADQLTFDNGTALSQRHAAGLVAISRYFLEHADTPTHRGHHPHLLVTIPIGTLEQRCGPATLGSGAPIDAATALAWACDAGITRIITGPVSEPLEVGRTTRLISPAIAKALHLDDRHCRWPGCTAPVWATEAHHVIPWGPPDNGDTRLPNLALLCWHHHHLVHRDPLWHLTLEPKSRRLTVRYGDRLIGTTDPPGRRTAPVVAPVLPTETPSEPAPMPTASNADPTQRDTTTIISELAHRHRQHSLFEAS